VCGFSDQITDFFITRVAHKPGEDMDSHVNLNSVVNLDRLKNGSCFSPKDEVKQGKFYRKDVTPIPKNILNCSDNVRMVEFGDSAGSSIQFSYTYRPWLWLNVSAPLRKSVLISLKSKKWT
jgi:hypothetical protein